MLHHQIRTETQELIKVGCSADKAIRHVLSKIAYMFEELLESDSMDSEESDDTDIGESESDVEESDQVQIGEGKEVGPDWSKIFDNMSAGKISHSPSGIYRIPETAQEGGSSSGVTLITPTEQQVQIVKSEIKRQIESAEINPRAKRMKANLKTMTKKTAKAKYNMI